jgi:hypothetical protein
MNEEQIDAWTSMIRIVAKNIGSTPIAIIEDLLKHAKKDEMSDEDRAICLRQLEMLKSVH